MPSCEPALATIYRGDSRNITVEVKNSAGVPVDLTGQTVTLTLAKTRQADPVCTIANSTHFDAVNGITKFTITTAHTTSTTVGMHHIDVVIDNGSGGVSTIYIGTVRIEDRVAQP